MIQNRELVNKIFDSITKLISLDKKRIVSHKGLRLHPSEIHLLMFLYHVQDANITAIADKIDLTKGAVSQTLSRLQKKGIITKKMYPEKKNELHVQFTDEGNQLLAVLIKDKKSQERKYTRYLKTLSEQDKEIVSQFLDKMVSTMGM